MSVILMHVILFISQYIIIDVSHIDACDTVYFNHPDITILVDWA